MSGWWNVVMDTTYGADSTSRDHQSEKSTLVIIAELSKKYVHRWAVFWTSIALVLSFVPFVYFGGVSASIYVECPSTATFPCKNPLQSRMDLCPSGELEKCSAAFLLPGESIGKKPHWYVAALPYIWLLITVFGVFFNLMLIAPNLNIGMDNETQSGKSDNAGKSS